MIRLTRRQVRDLRAVFRRTTLGITHRGPVEPLVIHAHDGQLDVRHRQPHLTVVHSSPLHPPSSGRVALPLEALADAEGPDDSIVTLETTPTGQTLIRWSDHGIPRSGEFTVALIPEIGSLPDAPTDWAEVPADLIVALAEATATAVEDDNSRYTLSSLLLKQGPTGHEVVATDGRQILIRGGFRFPWSGDVLIRRSPVFAARALPRDRPWSIGWTATHVVLRSEAWTILLEVQTQARFPRIDLVFPTPEATTSRLRLDPSDALFLADSLSRLPGSDLAHAPVTVELNGRIAIRAAGSTAEPVTELVLSRSSYTGSPARFATNREPLARALRLGFTEVEIVDPGTPLVCRSGPDAYAWQPLSADSVLPASEEVTRIESPAHPLARSEEPTPRESSPRATPALIERPRPEAPSRATAESASDPSTSGLAGLIGEAESLHEALGQARARSQRLLVALRRHRKQARWMAATLQTLRQLKLQEVAE